MEVPDLQLGESSSAISVVEQDQWPQSSNDNGGSSTMNFDSMQLNDSQPMTVKQGDKEVTLDPKNLPPDFLNLLAQHGVQVSKQTSELTMADVV